MKFQKFIDYISGKKVEFKLKLNKSGDIVELDIDKEVLADFQGFQGGKYILNNGIWYYGGSDNFGTILWDSKDKAVVFDSYELADAARSVLKESGWKCLEV